MFSGLFKFLLITLALSSLGVFADVKITEIMYDAEGSDAGREWVEIYNNGASAIDIETYHFFEAGIHHGLFPDNFSMLDPGEYAVIVQDLDIFSNEYSDVNMIKSSFSLNNTGEELGISRGDKSIDSSLSYDSSFGASNNGQSLHYGSSGWQQASPSPGSSQISNTNTSFSNQSSSQSQVAKNKTKTIDKKEQINYYTGYIIPSGSFLPRSSLNIESYIVHTKNSKNTKKLGGIYYLSFGDGTFLESESRIDTYHEYVKPGTYTLVLEYYRSRLSKENDDEPLVYTEKDIVIENKNIEITAINSDGSVILMNNSSQKIDLYNWDLNNEFGNYTFPKYTYIHPKKELTIPFSVHGITFQSQDVWYTLRNENTITISSFTNNTHKLNRARGISAPKKTTSQIESKVKSEPNGDSIVSLSHLDEYLLEHPDKELVEFEDEFIQNEVASDQLPINLVIGSGFLALILILIRSYYFSKNDTSKSQEIQGDIELID